MRAYELRRGQGKKLEGDGLRAIAAETFGSANVEDAKVVASFGAIEKLIAWTDGKQLFVDMVMKPGVPDELATETISRNNRFLEAATGYTAKERGKKAQGAAKKGTA
ncbi:MAG TPA: DUF5611 family protein [Thermoplasmata archaeon]|nr:DUF5611 family protein [Thermoplasmata archaeon]